MGKHVASNQPWIPLYMGYQCEGCKGIWATVQVDEGVLPTDVVCLATEACSGLVVHMMNPYPDVAPPDDVPILIEWFKPNSDFRFVDSLYLSEHLENDGLLAWPTPVAPDWVKRRINYFGTQGFTTNAFYYR